MRSGWPTLQAHVRSWTEIYVTSGSFQTLLFLNMTDRQDGKIDNCVFNWTIVPVPVRTQDFASEATVFLWLLQFSHTHTLMSE